MGAESYDPFPPQDVIDRIKAGCMFGQFVEAIDAADRDLSRLIARAERGPHLQDDDTEAAIATLWDVLTAINRLASDLAEIPISESLGTLAPLKCIAGGLRA
jgi:hypothetical protein